MKTVAKGNDTKRQPKNIKNKKEKRNDQTQMTMLTPEVPI